MNRSEKFHVRCIIAFCKKTTTNSQNKVFVMVKETLKQRFCVEANSIYIPGRRIFCCEDHQAYRWPRKLKKTPLLPKLLYLVTESFLTMSEQIGPLSSVEIQQQYYETVGDADWELYSKDDRKYLLQKIAIALCGPPKIAGDLVNTDNKIKLEGYEVREEEQTMAVFNKICEQAKYSHNNENIFISIIRVVCVAPSEVIPPYKPDPEDYWLDLHDKKGEEVTICIFHVFGVRKCISTKLGVKSCRFYIDHEGRVYKNWEAYLKENNLIKSVMIVPTDGVYKANILSDGSVATLNNDGNTPLVDLTVLPTPALGIKARILSITDTASTVANIGALAGVIIGAASIPLLPVAAPIAFGIAGITATVTGVYGIVRSSIHLADRGQHEQPIGLDNAEARASWLNITLSTAGISFSAAGKLLSLAASTGTDVKILINALNFLKYTNLVTGFIGVTNSMGEMILKFYKYKELPTKLELFQFTSSVLFLGLGVMSNQTAQDIVQDAQAKTINEARDSLSSNNKRKSFDKATAETRRLKGVTEGNADIIKSLRKIEDKNDFFAKLRTANKEMNKNKVRVSLSEDGRALFNNKQKVSIHDLSKLGKKGRNQLFSKYGPAEVSTKNAPTRIYTSAALSCHGFKSSNADNSLCLKSEDLIKIPSFLLRFSTMDQEIIAEILSDISAVLHNAFILICVELLTTFIPLELKILQGYENYMIKLVYFVFEYIKTKQPLGKCDYNNDSSFTLVLKEFFQDGRIKKNTILLLKKRLMHWLQNDEMAKNKVFNDINRFREMFNIKFHTIKAEKVIKIGVHQILIKETTIDFLSDYFKNFEQNKCNLFLKLCFSIICEMSPTEVDELRFVNLDEDLLMIIANYLRGEEENLDNILKLLSNDGERFIDIILSSLISRIKSWLSKQNLRQHKICNQCWGICYG